MHTVSVIVPVYDDPDRLELCLQALDRQTYPSSLIEVIVIDNGSPSDVARIVDRHSLARLLQEPERGSYRARNRGVSRARGRVLAFTDADCLPEPEWIERGVAALDALPRPGLVAGRVLLFPRDPLRPTPAEIFDGRTYLLQDEHVREGFGATANLFTFKRLFDEIGLFDESLSSAGDLEWGRRATSGGRPLSYAPEVRVRHPARRTFGELRGKAERIMRGFRSLRLGHPDVYRRLGRNWIRDAAAPVRKTLNSLRDPDLEGVRSRVCLIAALAYVQAIQILELFRPALGGPPRR